MANEATLVYETDVPIQMTVSESVGIERGTLLTLSDPLTAALVTDSTAAVGGIASKEQIADQGITKLAVYRGGIFKVTASGAVTVGQAVVFEVGNTVGNKVGTGHHSGFALETATNGETFLMELNPGHHL